MRETMKTPASTTASLRVAPSPTTQPATDRLSIVGEGRIRCRRVEAVYTVAEHKDCPYCFGTEAEIRTGDHARFCDFKPGEDPICFGFPADLLRY